MNKKINIITLGDIFENLETDEKAFEFLKYIKELQEENKKQKEVLDKIKKMFEHSNLIKYYYGMSYEFEINDFKDDILELLEEIE